jgi:predicted lipoprotein with Yx(FWY)xxD motif
MRLPAAPLLIAALLAATGCGADEPPTTAGEPTRTAATQATTPSATTPSETTATRPPERKGTRITLRDSEFGTMLFNAKRQAIYVFQRDRRNRTVCHGECADAWPPVLTKGEPVAGRGVDEDLLGTLRRRDGTVQVTYAGRPLYYYANEGPGQVLCHNVNLNGGLWWVVGPDGRRRA